MGADVAGAGAEFAFCGWVDADAAVGEQIAEGGKFGGMRDVANLGLFLGEVCLDFVVLFVAFFDDESGRVAETAHVLQGLEDVFLVGFFGAADLILQFFLFFLGEVFEESLLEFTGVAVVVLDDLGRQIV